MIRNHFALSVGFRLLPLSRTADRNPRPGALSCVWIPTGNLRQPLACVWIDQAMRSFIGVSSLDGIESLVDDEVPLLCALCA
jgi:hypothetical protein